MKKIVLTQTMLVALMCFIGLSLTSSCILADGIKGNGNVVTEERSVSGFDAISVGGAYDVYLTQGSGEELKIEAESNLMEYIKTKVMGGTLYIECDENLKPTKSMKLYITFKDLEEIEASGACDIESVNAFKLDELELDVSGASEINFDLNLDRLEADFSGASDVKLAGTAGEMEMDISGAGELDALELEAEKVKLDVSGAATAKVYAKTFLEVDVSGAATVKYKGNPQVDSEVSGAGSVKPY
jgi:hypothetical protein